MSPEQQRIKIAEVCGWNPSPLSKGKWCHDSNLSMAKNGAYSVWVGINYLPNYLNDLNAMHEAEKVMTDKQKENYPINLARVIRHQLGIDDGKSIYHWKFSTFATAAQRAEAFLKTLNLWTEE